MQKYANVKIFSNGSKKSFCLAGLGILACFVTISCKKKTVTGYPQTYTANMGGTRTWTGTYTVGFFGPGPANDTQTFAITVNNASTITVQNTTLHYRSYNDSDKSMFFVGSVTSQDSVSVIYYYLADSLVYFSYSRPTLCCYEEYYLSTQK
jgi:hypothetical protein